jgi:ABC-type lipoprotein export system ATPase subunit
MRTQLSHLGQDEFSPTQATQASANSLASRHGPGTGPSGQASPGADAPVISLVGVRKTYGVGSAAVEALKGIDFAVWPNRLTAIVGPSGSGKSTLLNLLGGLDTPDTGQIRFGHHDLTAMNEAERTRFRADHIGFVFQFLNLLPGLTCAQNAMLGGVIAGMAPRAAQGRAAELLEIVGLGDKVHSSARELSGGQMQRVAIARALMNDAPLLLADEPTGNLDERNAEEIIALLHDRAVDGRAVVLVTHNNDLADRYGDEVHIVRDGLILNGSTPAAFGAAEPEHAASPPPAEPSQPSAAGVNGAVAEIEVRPVDDPKALLTLLRALEGCASGGEPPRLASVEDGSATLVLPAASRDETVAALAIRLAREFDGGVRVGDTQARRVVFELGAAR